MTAEASHEALDAFGIAWRLGATLFFVVLNGFFVAAEFALVKVRASRIDELAAGGSGAARVAQHILKHMDRYLSACQLGITLASLILGALGEPAVSVLLIAAAGGVGFEVSPESEWLPIVSITLAFAVITTLHMTVGEQAPKMWALRRSEGMALRTAHILRGFTWLFGPFIAAINAISNWLLRMIGLPADHGHEGTPTAEEIRSILSLSATAGHISEREYELTENVFRTMDLEVRHIIVPRVDVAYLSLQNDAEENLRLIRSGSHSRYALCEIGLDTIVGFVHTKDVLDAVLGGRPPDLRAIARGPLFVSDTMSVSDFLLEAQAKQAHCAVVLDEHGTAMGLAFREDALEEIVGPLGDEFDERERNFRKLGESVYEMSGRVPLPEACSRTGLELGEGEEEGEETIGGHVTARLGRLPAAGDQVRIGPSLATVLAVERHRVARLRLEPAPEEEAASESE
jgi:CBS domain containing-hemolysin-like protein